MPTLHEFLSDYLAFFGSDFAMVMPTLKEIEAATGLTLTKADLEQAVSDYQTNFYLVVRGPDEFANEVYIWITPKPPDVPVTTPPDRCWIIRAAHSDATRQIDDGILVFTKSGYAIGLMAAQGFGDFNVEAWDWGDLAIRSKRDTAVIDYVEGRTPNVIRLRKYSS